ncbi:CBS domain-containing protein [Salinicoccus sp. ID82-1]|uniref:CBS domain-containing protein n=1 Tax=Salinicoccus sp. ID82-1 TaxID=2820269 RepID=UPI001F444FE3|nr:CBS domain-containing protein [Salinicoccus sp. ID82-1]MCG1008480.1 CBS domain-containing protein [Salinicoccus sp. ID82-1]
MKVSEIMTTEVETCGPETTIQEVASKMMELDVGSIPVTEGGNLRGIITDRDLVIRGIAAQFSLDTPVNRIISSDNITGTPDMDVEEAANLMAQQRIRRLPIIEDNKVVGIVSLGDVAVDEEDPEDSEIALEEISKPAEPDK